MSFDYYQSVIGKMRKGTADDSFVDVNETLQVVNSKVVLSEIPDKFNGLVVKTVFGNTTLVEIKKGTPINNQYLCDYNLGVVHFPETVNNERYVFSYKGRGAVYLAADRIYSKQMNSNEIIQTLRDILDEADSIINLSERFTNTGAYLATKAYYGRNIVTYDNAVYMCINNSADGIINIPPTNTTHWMQMVSVKQAVENANAAASSANTAATNANEAADNAETQATYAKNQGDYAKGIRDNFGHKGDYSPTATYKNGNVVTYGGINYFCIQDTTAGIDPLNGAYWTVVSPQASINDETWIATEGQTVFTITNGNYVPNQGNIEVWVGGVPQVSGVGYTETNNTTITLSEGVTAGTTVFAKWYEGHMSITKSHKSSHALGGQDEIDLTQLRNYKEKVSDEFGRVDTQLADIAINVKTFGAKGDGVTDDTVAIQNAVNACAGGGTLFFPNGVYLISQTIVLPTITYANVRFVFLTIKGEKPTLTENRALIDNAYGSIIKTTDKNITAFKTSPKPIVEPYAGGWTRELSIIDLTILGTQNITHDWNDPLVTDRNSCGLDFDGIMNFYTNNLHIEGFGVGLKLNDGFIDCAGSTNIKHCYKGVALSRTDSGKDLIAIFDNLRSNSNKINMELDNARIVILKSGTFATASSHNEIGTPNVVIKNSSELDLHIQNFTLESNRTGETESLPLIDIDPSGIHLLAIKDCNVTSLINSSLLKVRGFFGTISVRDTLFHEYVYSYDSNTTLSLTNPMIHIAFNSGDNSKLLGMNLIIEGNDPEFLQGFIKNDYSKDPTFDYMPKGYTLRNGIPENDKRIINVNNPIGSNYSYSINNPLVGNARMYWNVDDTGLTSNLLDVHLTDSRGNYPLRDEVAFFVNLIVNDNGGTKVPIVYQLVNGLGQAKTIYSGSFFTQYACKVGEHLVNGVTFSKYVLCVMIFKPKDIFFDTGIKNIRISNIYGGNENTGIEYVGVYARREINRKQPFYSSVVLGGGYGYFKKGDIVYNDNPTAGGYIGWICIADGLSASANWKGFGLIQV